MSGLRRPSRRGTRYQDGGADPSFNWNVLNGRNDNPQNHAFLAAINAAHTSIQVMTPILNAPAVIHASANAANRGVRVQILVSKGFNDERVKNRIAGGTNDAALSELRKLVKSETLDVRYFRNSQGDPAAPVPEGNAAGYAEPATRNSWQSTVR